MIDHVTDLNRSMLYRIGKSIVFPEFVQNFTPMTEKEASDLDLRLFADPLNRRFPIGSAEDTWLSTVYFEKQAAELDPDDRNAIAGRLLTALNVWELKGQFQKKAETKPRKPITVIRCGDHDVVINELADLQKLAEDILDHAEKYPFDTRSMTACQLMNLADKFTNLVGDAFQTGLRERLAGMQEAPLSIGLREGLQKAACDMKAPKTNVLKTIQSRQDTYVHEGFEQFIEKTAELLKEVTSGPTIVESETLQKVAGELDNLDRLAGLHRRGYSSAFMTPENSFNGMTSKQAARLRHFMCRLPNGKIVLMNKTAGKEDSLQDFLKEALSVSDTTGNLYRDLSGLSTADADAFYAAFPELFEV